MKGGFDKLSPNGIGCESVKTPNQFQAELVETLS